MAEATGMKRLAQSKKSMLALVGIGAVLLIAIGSALLKKFADIDITEVAQWAMVTVVGATGMGQATIAYEDARTKSVCGQDPKVE